MIQGVRHIGIAVSDLEEATRFYTDVLGSAIYDLQKAPHYGADMVFIPIGDVEVALVAPTSPNSPVAKFLDVHGPGVQHIAYVVEDVVREHARLKSLGVRMVEDEPVPGPRNTLCTYIHPKDAGGVLIGLFQELDED